MGPGLFGFGVSLAIEREQGLLTLKQALPQPPGAYLLARAAMAMLFVAIISLMLTSMAVFVGHVPLTFSQGIRLFADRRARRTAVLRHRHVGRLDGLRRRLRRPS